MHANRILFAALCLATCAIGCGGTVVSSETDAAVADAATDTAPTPDVARPDVPVTPDAAIDAISDVAVDARVPRCGDRFLDPGESCDDGNNTSGDGCSAMCRFEARCGDGMVNPGEVCDDGNNASGDGCRSDCLSNERCGNNIVDTAVGLSLIHI